MLSFGLSFLRLYKNIKRLTVNVYCSIAEANLFFSRENPMSYKQDFFSTGSHEYDTPQTKRFKKANFVWVGEHVSGAFRAIAAVLIEQFMQQPLTKEQAHLYINLLERYELLFSKDHGVLTPDKFILRMQKLIDDIPIKQLITDMGYVLRQFAVDELCENVTVHPHVFLSDNKSSIAPGLIRQDGTQLDVEISLAALSMKLGLDIRVRIASRDKSLPKFINYYSSHKGLLPMIQLALDEGCYKPSLSGALALMSLDTTQCKVSNNRLIVNDPDVDDIIENIADSQLKLKKRFDTLCHDLKILIQRGPQKEGLSKQNLLDIYIKSLAQISAEASFISDSKTAAKLHDIFELNLTWSNHDEYVMTKLILAISRSICAGHLSASLLYNDNDSSEYPSMGLFS